METCATNINLLDDYSLLEVFSYLSLKEKIVAEKVCKRWHDLARQLLDKQWSLGTTWSTDEDHKCLDTDCHSVNNGDIREVIAMSNGWFYDLTIEKSQQSLEVISNECPNVRCLHISSCVIDVNCFSKIVQLFPLLKCLNLKNNVLKSVIECQSGDTRISTENEWHSIGLILAPFVKHLQLDSHYEFRMNDIEIESLIQPLVSIEEFRIGPHFERSVTGRFISSIPRTCRLFYSLGKELSDEALDVLNKNHSKSLTHLSYISKPFQTTDSLIKIGNHFQNLVKLKINLSFNEIIFTLQSPLKNLILLKELSVDMNSLSDAQVDDALIWCIKDGIPSLQLLEISRANLSLHSFNSIYYCIPYINTLILRVVQIQCSCPWTGELEYRSVRYECSFCRESCWRSVANYHNLKELHILDYYYRNNKPKQFHRELSQTLPVFKCLRVISLCRYDISSAKLLESLNELMKNTEPDDKFLLKLKSISFNNSKIKIPKIVISRDNFML